MAKLAIKKASTDVTVYVFIQDSSKTTGAGLAGLVYNTTDLVGSYVRPLAARQALSLATLAAVDSAHSDGGFKEIDATNMPGVYRLDLPDAVCATGVNSVVVMLKGAANMAPVVLEIQLTDFDLNTAAITAADVADAVWDEATADHTTGTTFGALDTNVDAILADTGTDGVIVASGTVTTLTNLPSMPNDWLTAAGVKADAVTKIQNGLATPTNITAGTITTATNLTNLPTIPNDWITAAGLKTDAVDEIADAIWDEAIAGHTTVTTFGGKNQKVVPSETINDYKADVSAITGAALSAAGIDAILDEVVVGTYTMRQILTVTASALAGKLSGGGSTTLTFRGINDASNVIVATVDANGNRSAVTVTV
jgi:hypothetical protein